MQLFNAIAYTGEKYVKYHNINNRERFITFLTTTFPTWVWVTWYDAKTRDKVECQRR